MKTVLSWGIIGMCVVLGVFAQPGYGALPADLQHQDLVFVYVHGFGEFKEVVPFEQKMRETLESVPYNSRVFTYRWEWRQIELTKVVAQWNQAKQKADEASEAFLHDILLPLEERHIPYVVVAYSLGSRVVAGALNAATSPLESVRGIYFLGSALPHTYMVKRTPLPEGMKIVNYYSKYLDEVLKISFYNAEGINAGGEIGFDDTVIFQNYRTVCTHLHKGGPLQRDYSNLAPAIASLAFFHEQLFIPGDPPNVNLELPVGSGSLHWNDLFQFEESTPPLLVQQNVNTHHYRIVALNRNGGRIRKAWGDHLHPLLQSLHLFPEHHVERREARDDSLTAGLENVPSHPQIRLQYWKLLGEVQDTRDLFQELPAGTEIDIDVVLPQRITHEEHQHMKGEFGTSFAMIAERMHYEPVATILLQLYALGLFEKDGDIANRPIDVEIEPVLSIKRGSVTFLNDTGYMRFLPDRIVWSKPQPDVQERELRLSCELGAHFGAKEDSFGVGLNCAFPTSEVPAPYEEYGYMWFPIQEDENGYIARFRMQVSEDFEGDLGYWEYITYAGLF